MSSNIFYNFLITVLLFCTPAFSQGSYGIFEGYSTIGTLGQQEAVNYDSDQQTYKITGSGEINYVWKKLSGDFIIHAQADFTGVGKDARLGWMIRQSLKDEAPMLSASVCADEMAVVRFRNKDGHDQEEILFPESKHPDVIQLERRSGRYIMSVAQFGKPLVVKEITGAEQGDEVYVGLFSRTNKGEKATFSNVRIVVPAPDGWSSRQGFLGSHIEIVDVTSGLREIIYTDPGSVQAPNWTPDNKYLIYNKEGLIYRMDIKERIPEVVNTDFVKNNNNDHVISFDGKMLGLSSSSGPPEYGSLIYTVPIEGGKPDQITPLGPSYLHGWSPDGEWLTYTGRRDGEYDIYKIPAKGGDEVKLTSAPGLDDGSEYSPDGKYIYFNSVRTGSMEIWRMTPDGESQEQLTHDKYNNWFPHISPDGKWVVFLSYMEDVDPGAHPYYKPVYLRMMPAEGGEPRVIAYLYGGQGSINTPSWSPDSKKVAFVSNTIITDNAKQ